MTEKLQKILYVEDDESISEVANMILQDIGGFEVKHYFSGQEAIDALDNYQPQLILMDVMMPGIDGPETLRRIRNIPEHEHTPVIFMTAKAQIHEQESYFTMGALGVVVKPFEPMQLCSIIENLWRKK